MYQQSKRAQYIIVACLILSLFFFQGCSKKQMWPWGSEDTEEDHIFFTLEKEAESVTSYDYYSQKEFYADMIDDHLPVTQSFSLIQQDQISDIIAGLCQMTTYSFMHPLMIQNPFGTNTRSLYVNFGPMGKRISIQYTISVEDTRYPDFSNYLYVNQMGEWIEGQIIGLIPGYKNLISIKIKDSQGKKLAEHIYILDIPQLSYETESLLETSVGNQKEVTQGLFGIMSEYKDRRSYLFYDEHGVLRAELPIEDSAPALKMLSIKNALFYPINDSNFIQVEATGRVSGWYEVLPDSIIDYDYNKIGNQIYLLQRDGKIQIIDNENNQYKEVAQVDSIPFDDILFTNLYCIDEEDLILFSKSKDSILRINNMIKRPVIRWIIGAENVWDEYELTSDLLYIRQEEQPFKIQSLQVTKSRKLKDGQFYLVTLIPNEKQDRAGLFYQKYMVDENKNSYRKIQELYIGEEKENTILFYYGNHFLICNKNGRIEEYKENGELLLRLHFSQKILPETFGKYTMARIWF